MDNIYWKNFIDTENEVKGIAIVKKGFKAKLHKHEELEEYHFIYGKGKLYKDGKITIIESPKKIIIDSNIVHAMTPISDIVILLYVFNKGSFKSIKYTYLNKFLE